MRTLLLLPLLASAAGLAGCGAEVRDQAARSVPERDLTLVTQTAEVKTASRLETQQLRIHRTVHPSRPAARRAPAPRPSRPQPVPTPALAAPKPVAQPAPANDRELLPGKTVTLIPASTGPSVGSDGTDDIPAIDGRGVVMGGGGGTCRGRGRGPGIGIATAPRPDFR